MFSQLRAQNQVLKKGVVDEQANSASLKVKVKRKQMCSSFFTVLSGITYLFSSFSGAAEAEGPEFEEAGAGDGQSQLQEPTTRQEGGAAAGGAGC